LFYRAWHTAFTKLNIMAGFEATGLSPLNAEVILQRFKLKEVERPSSSESTSSHENEKLCEALYYEKRRRQRGKPLLLEAPAEYHGGAVFWSPTKQRAKELQKQEKQAILKERARLRVLAKEVRLQQKEDQAREREERRIAKQVEKQLHQDQQAFKK
ncbi:uncharacterized protein EI97DRAFT_351024, partial [Westerdykella ornata]